jgi:hypothetical protein
MVFSHRAVVLGYSLSKQKPQSYLVIVNFLKQPMTGSRQLAVSVRFMENGGLAHDHTHPIRTGRSAAEGKSNQELLLSVLLLFC